MHYHIPAIVGAEVAHLLHKALSDHPPTKPKLILPGSNNAGSRPLGNYLLRFGYITPDQLVAALALQHQYAERGDPWALGEILIQQKILHPQVLTAMLLVQMMDRMVEPGASPRFLGEHLIMSNTLTPLQLAPALQLQTKLRQNGERVRIGEILLEQRILNLDQLGEVLLDQQCSRDNELFLVEF